jgi:hypothetical protein
MTAALRTIHAHASARHVPDLLQALFATEVLSPGRRLWIVSPWISDVALLDNRTGGFLSLEPGWPRAVVRLGQVLLRLLRSGQAITVATRPAEHNRPLLERLRREAAGLALTLRESEELHAKGILADTFFLSGSMNFTHNGITINEEIVTYVTDPAEIARQRVIFSDRWGSRP